MKKNNAMKRFTTKIPWLLAVVVVGVTLVYGFWPEPVAVDLVQVKRGRLEVTVNDDGMVRAQGYAALETQHGGKSSTLHVIWEDHRLSPTVVTPIWPIFLDHRQQ